jgi:hypothetical protein
MALHRKPGAQIIRTPAPDENARVQSYGGSSLAPGMGGPTTLLGKNLRDSLNDEAMAKVLATGSAGRGDAIPAGEVDPLHLDANSLPAGGELQQRKISADSYPIAAGGSMVNQQDANKVFGDVVARPQRAAHKLNANGIRALEHNVKGKHGK